MILKSFKARNFRNIESCSLDFSEGVNLLRGENAQGKTNAVEGIYLFARGRSFRTPDDKDLVKFSAEGFSIEIEYTDKNGDNKLEYALFGKEKRRKKNGYRLKSASEMVGSFRAVLFYPDDLSLVKGGPDERRDFLNIGISQCYPSYIGYYKRFKEALENRNALLKAASKGRYIYEEELISWSEVLAEYSSYINIARRDYIKKLELYAKEEVFEISEGKEELTLSYKSNIKRENASREEIEAEYKEIFTENLEREKIVGTSLYGPQRDDLEIFISKKEAKIFASQGQQRSIVLSLKLAEGEVSREICGEYPVYIFDDVLSELDKKRQGYVLQTKPVRQIIITSCENNSSLIKADKIIEVSGGKYE